MPDFIFSARRIDNNEFGIHPDSVTHYLIVEDGADSISPKYIVDVNYWVDELMKVIENKNDILIFIHGYNVSDNDLLKTHRSIKNGLANQNFKGHLVSFDWPCDDKAIVYLVDRHKAILTALQLVRGGISILAEKQHRKCKTNVHLLAHSTGAYVVREAFEDAQNANGLSTQDWLVSQLIFISGDISSNSMNLHSKCDAIYDHTTRVTNFYNPYDQVLALSNVKRLGFENRVGRVGFPANMPSKCVDVNSGFYYNLLDTPMKKESSLSYSHSWYFDPEANTDFMKDLCYIIQGDIDRNVIPTRKLVDGILRLVKEE